MAAQYIITNANMRPLCYSVNTESWVPRPQSTIFPSLREAIAHAPREVGVRIENPDDPGGGSWKYLDGSWVSGSRTFLGV